MSLDIPPAGVSSDTFVRCALLNLVTRLAFQEGYKRCRVNSLLLARKVRVVHVTSLRCLGRARLSRWDAIDIWPSARDWWQCCDTNRCWCLLVSLANFMLGALIGAV